MSDSIFCFVLLALLLWLSLLLGVSLLFLGPPGLFLLPPDLSGSFTESLIA